MYRWYVGQNKTFDKKIHFYKESDRSRRDEITKKKHLIKVLKIFVTLSLKMSSLLEVKLILKVYMITV